MARTEARGSRLSKEFARSVQLGDVETGIYREGVNTQKAVGVEISVGRNKYEFSVFLGNIAEAGASAVAFPSNAKAEFGLGASENAFLRRLDSVEQGMGKRLRAILSEFAVNNVLPFGEGVAFPVHKKFGTRHVIMINGDSGKTRLNNEQVAIIARDALEIADHMGVDSLAVPEIGREVLDTSSKADIWSPIFRGFLRYISMAQSGLIKGNVKKLSVVSYGIPDTEGMAATGEALSSVVNSAKESLRRGNY